ncbi:NAD(P)-dependent dehydrogenase (short-subunit alcohol dehydrogenase family) [Arenicella xantha]|uniref:NAD(P)-dependent dehydrogenase (Short-subunit alcohol dehydrogenase family) n=2 Tax=Arenicella xantha TaxID=644221 RepID=A0A395JJ24_9GAMM|nr:NAD(P)-dependent dehydrogenase (short-subunit alcohol dehydrogenase family) [Arenicella xantha]
MHEQFHCERNISDVFDYVVDFSRIQEWDHTIKHSSKVTDGPIQLGTKFDVIFAMGPRRIPIAYEITEWDYPNRAVLTGVSDNFTAIDTVTLTANESGCHLDWDAKIDFRGLAAKVVPFMESKIVSGGAQTIRDLEVALADDFPVPSLGTFSKLADKLILPGVLSFSKAGYAAHKGNWKPVTASIKGKHAIVTGATSGLGLATAKSLAHLGAHLTLVARDADKANAVARSITEQTGNANIKIEIADLALIADVKQLAARLLNKASAIDILVNNAGALFNDRQVTSEGLEQSFALLLLAPTILTEKLQPLLAKSDDARIINVVSGGMYATRISVSNLESTKGEYRGTDAYARAKRGLVIKGEQWAEQWAGDGITVHHMHPGWAQTPGVESSLPGFTKATRRILRTPDEGADTIVWLAQATEAGKTSGRLWLDRLPHSTHLLNKTRETDAQRIALAEALAQYAARFD